MAEPWEPEDEDWRPVVGYEGRYEVSSRGRVRSTKGSRRVMRLALSWKGYRRVALYKSGKHRTHSVHALVLEAFAGPKEAGMEASHLNGDRADNRASNLRWMTRAQNCALKHEHGTAQVGGAHTQAKLAEADVIAMREAFASGEADSEALAQRYSVGRSHVNRILRGAIWAHAGGPRRPWRIRGKNDHPLRRMTDQQRLEILSSDETPHALSQRLNVTANTVRHLRARAARYGRTET